MGRFFITDSQSAFDTARKINEKAGLEENGIISGEGFQGVIYDKRAISVENIFSSDNEAQLASVGTALYHESLGAKSFREDFPENDIVDVRDDILGHYAIIENRSSEIRIFGDSMGIYDIYYTDSESIFISDSLSLVAQCGGSFPVDDFGLLEYTILVNGHTSNTPYEGINRLTRTEYLEAKDGCLTILDANDFSESEFIFNSFEDAVQKYSENIIEIMDGLAEANVNIGLQLTGGLDSRTVLAGLLASNVSPLLMVGSGSGPVIDAAETDRQINSQIAEHFGLDQYILNWNADQPNHESDLLDSYLERYGFSYRYHGLSPNEFKEYEGEIEPYPEVLLLGAGAGFTNRSPWDDFESNEVYPVENLLRLLGNYPYWNILKDNNKFNDYLVSALEELDHISVSEEMTGKQILKTKFKIYPRGECFGINALNEFSYSLAPLNFPSLLNPLFKLPNEYRSKNRFQASVISNLNDELLTFPINSGGEALEVIEDRTGPSQIKLEPGAEQGGNPQPISKKVLLNLRSIADTAPGPVENTIKSLWKSYLLNVWNRYIATYHPDTLHEMNKSRLRRLPISDRFDFETGAIGVRPLHRLFLDSYATYNYSNEGVQNSEEQSNSQCTRMRLE